ncbi:MAG: BatA domain-containing protein [Edaphocola sp.]
MGFTFPLFLLAAILLAVPVLIHLFNLRKYKRVFFPDTRFLRDIKLSTNQRAQLRDRVLLALRLLFLAALVLAFARPFFGNGHTTATDRLAVIYIDNSYSMNLADGQQSLLQQAKKQAAELVGGLGNESRYLILTNDHIAAGRPLMRQEALDFIAQIKTSSIAVPLARLIASINSISANERGNSMQVYCYSDFQQNMLNGKLTAALPKETRVYLMPLNAQKAGNLYVDTAFFLSAQLDARQPSDLVVRVKQSGPQRVAKGNMQVSVDGQVRAVAALPDEIGATWCDTLQLQAGGKGWQQMDIALHDAPLTFDDTFRMAIRTAQEKSVLVLSEKGTDPYLQAAFRSFQSFSLVEKPAGSVRANDDWGSYSLVVLQDIERFPPSLLQATVAALQHGQNVLFFPGRNADVAALNASFKTLGDFYLASADTQRSPIAVLQEAHPLLRDVFEKVPDNVSLPVASMHFPLRAGISTNEQAVMSFRDGSPFLTQLHLFQGRLFACTAPLGERGSNFALGYYFAPLLYKMAVQGGVGNIYAATIGEAAAIWLPAATTGTRTVWHLWGNGVDAIPGQRPAGAGTNILLQQSAAATPGFYWLYNGLPGDSVLIGLNVARTESDLAFADQKSIERYFAPAKINWVNGPQQYQQLIAAKGNTEKLPVWKILVALAMLFLIVETWLLLRKSVSPKAAGGAAA